MTANRNKTADRIVRRYKIRGKSAHIVTERSVDSEKENFYRGLTKTYVLEKTNINWYFLVSQCFT